MASDTLRGKFRQAAEMPSPPQAHASAVRQKNMLPAKSLPARVVLAADTYISNLESLSGHELVSPFVGPSNSTGLRQSITEFGARVGLEVASNLGNFEAKKLLETHVG
jgi:hypothetical protein